MRLDRRKVLGAAAAGGAWLAAGGRAAGGPDTLYSAERTLDMVVVRAPSGAPVFRYLRESLPEGEKGPSVEGACYTHPLHAPSGAVLTDLGPADHPHHRGIFCAWVEVDGEQAGDWWGWGAKAPKEGRAIVNREARMTEVTGARATLRAINSWRAGEQTVLGERVTISATAAPGCHVLDFDYKFTVSTRRPVTIAANPFGGFCYRARPRGVPEITGPDGLVERPNAVFNRAETNWPASRWYDLTYRAADGTVDGVAVMDHPSNPLSTWHVHRGIHMLNPCIVAEGPLTIHFGEPLYLRYRVVAHDGAASSLDLRGLYEQFVSEP